MLDLREQDRQARAYLADPHRYFKAFSRTARRFQHMHPSPRYRVMTLVGVPADFLAKRPLMLHLHDRTHRVTSWVDVLATAVSDVVATNPTLVRALAMAGFVPWMVPPAGEGDILAAFARGEVALELSTEEEVFVQLQWLLLMAGVKLNEVVVQVDPYSDAAWLKRSEELRAKRADEARVLREIDEARRRYAEEHADEEFSPSAEPAAVRSKDTPWGA